MSYSLYIGIGAGIGAACGGAAGYFMNKRNKPVSATTTAVVSSSKSIISATATISKELFGVQVTYFLPSSEFYTMLVRFENYLQFATERESLKAVVENIDNFLGMETLLHGRNPVSKAALPTLAEVARRKVINILNDIIAFSNEERPSPTKHNAMTAIKDEINLAMQSIIKDMHRALAAIPINVK